MGRENGKFKADRIHDKLIRTIDTSGDTGQRPENTEGTGDVRACHGILFTYGNRFAGEGKRVFIPSKKG